MGKRGKHSKKVFNDFRTQANNDLVELEEKKVLVQPKTDGQRQYINCILNNTITICKGPAGSGKTLIPVGIALQHILGRSATHDKLIIIRSVKEACGEEMGALPGDLTEKFSPWMGPIIDNLLVFIKEGKIDYLLKNNQIQSLPLAYTRGRSLSKSFVILDEAQNCTPEQILMVLTRIGEGSKLIINGDLMQSDLRSGQKNGLEDVISRLSGIPEIGICQLDYTDIVRNGLISEILRRYNK